MNTKPFFRSVAIAALTALAAVATDGCTTTAAVGAPIDETRFVIVRHAEKSSDDPKDPTLSDIGRARAQRLAELLAGERMTAVYATGYRRTQTTALPAAQAHGLEVLTYDAAMPAADFAARLRREHEGGTVLVVGHSNTVAAIASALCACIVAPLRDDEYDRWIVIRIDRNGVAELKETRY
jgi:broad specificity phosphatase PhoE